jgi:predicted membrane protein
MMSNLFLISIIVFYTLFALLCFYAGFKTIFKEIKEKRHREEMKSKLKLVKGQKYDSKN